MYQNWMTSTLFFSAFLISSPKALAVDVVNYAETASGTRYGWGREEWDPKDPSWGKVDCSGLVAKSLGYPRRLPYREPIVGNRPDSWDLANPRSAGLPFATHTNYSSARRGDAMSYSYGKYSGRGHAFIVKNVLNGVVQTVEAKGSHYKAGNYERSLSSLRAKSYRVVKRNGYRPANESNRSGSNSEFRLFANLFRSSSSESRNNSQTRHQNTSSRTSSSKNNSILSRIFQRRSSNSQSSQRSRRGSFRKL